MAIEKFKVTPAAHLLLRRNNELLLLRRKNTGYEDGNYSVVAGHIEANESPKTAMIREAREEAGIIIKPEDLGMAVVIYRLSNEERLDFFFTTETWRGEINNMEPNKCDDLSWFNVNDLPKNVIPYVSEAIKCYQKGIKYSEFGW
jgi:8-oxo-dGTP diphosphatase